MKAKSRFLGIDDGPFHFGDDEVPLVGVAVQAPSYIEAVLMTRAHVDGRDATERILGMIRTSRYREGLRMVFLNGIAVGGFNVIDLNTLHRDLRVPVVTITRRAPDLDAIRDALRRKFDDWEERWALIKDHGIEQVTTHHTPLHVTYVGATRADVVEAIALTTVRGALPEPLRVAHLVAAATVKGESHGRA
jgi:endonuclease V-like protein UPF0215 family